ncbi:uncharacterized protein ACB058_019691 isoform 1-T1 [Synchiropus picturatus]
MRKSFVTDKSMVISIPVESYNNVWPEQFHCLFKDAFKVFVHHGRPTALGVSSGMRPTFVSSSHASAAAPQAAQVTSGIFLLLLSLLFGDSHTVYVFPAVLYMVTGLLSLASGHAPNMPVAKLSLLLNIISVLSSVAAVCLGIFASGPRVSKVTDPSFGGAPHTQ